MMQNRNYSAEGTCGRQHWNQQEGRSSRNTEHPIDHSVLVFAASISSIGNNHRNKNYASGHQSNLRSVSAV
jgi:hypothetical protein